MKRFILGLVGLVVLAFAQQSIEGTWEGGIKIHGIELGMEVEFVTGGDELTATIDIPQQGAKDLELINVTFEGSKVHFELEPEPGTLAIFDGELAEGEITGDFTQGPSTGTFYLKPLLEVELPYIEEEVKIESTEDVTLAGTLTIPEGEGPFPATILITGSGKQDRDENIFGFKIFAIIADHLTRNGIAVLRCDDRGFLESTGEGGLGENTSKDYAEDVKAQVDYLKTRTEVDTTKIGLLGHSEGGIIAGMVAADNPDVEFVVLMAGTALPGDEVLKAQMVALLEAEGLSEEEIAEQRALQDQLLEYALTGEGEDELRKDLKKVTKAYIKRETTKKERKALGNLNDYVEKRLEGQLEVVRSSWYRFFLTYDPREDLKNVDSRVLAFFGAKDVQVVAEQNAPALEALFTEIGKENYIIKTCCTANHLFQAAETGAVSEYAQLPKEFVPCFLPNVTNFILGFPQVPCPDCKDGGCEKARTGKCPHHK